MAKGRSRANGEGTIYKRVRNGKTKWYAALTIGWDQDGKRIPLTSPGFDQRAQASTWLTDRQSEKNKGDLVLPSKNTVGGFIGDWLQNTLSTQVGPSTIHLYRNMYNWYILPGLGSIGLADLKPQNVHALYRKLLDDGKSPRTVQLVHVVLRKSLQQAVDWGELAKNPVLAVKPPRVERQEVASLSPEEIIRFLQAAKGERLHALFTVAVTVGLRRGELLGLRWRDIDLEAGTLTVAQSQKKIGEELSFGPTKTKSSRRTVDLPTIAIAALKRWKAEQAQERLLVGEAWEHPELVFTNQIGGPVNPNNLRNRDFIRLLEKAKVQKIRFHDLRHSAATLMAVQGVSDRVLQEVLGHSNITITKTFYVAVLQQQKKEAALKVDAFLAAAEKKAR